jgi:hypothetical protein
VRRVEEDGDVGGALQAGHAVEVALHLSSRIG